jgi:hypothetical protein
VVVLIVVGAMLTGVVCGLLTIRATLAGDDWDDWQPARCAVTSFCDTRRDRIAKRCEDYTGSRKVISPLLRRHFA